ncbi:MAG: MBL fold metallo-hydrolase [Clostridia bacterium]|nr:MBL fold metallo-hydrolase [Clostridia bacterium]
MASNATGRNGKVTAARIIGLVILILALTFVNNLDVFLGHTNEPVANYSASSLDVYFFDVGQADSILLMTDDKVMLVDTGNAGDAAMDYNVKDKINLSHELKRLGVNKIDVLVATHPHEDHMGSMYKIIEMFDVKDLYSNSILPESQQTGYYKRFVSALEESDTHLITPTTLSEEEIKAKVEAYNQGLPEEEKVVYNPNDYIRVGDEIPFGNAKVTMLAPNASKYSDTNDYSIVLMVEFEGVKLLLTGDAGKLSEKEMLKYAAENDFDLKADILKVGHHGSRTANTEEFIAKVQPSHSIMMVGKDNSYGLPDEDVIERLEKHGSVIYQTQDAGDVKLTINDGKYAFDLDFAHEEK